MVRNVPSISMPYRSGPPEIPYPLTHSRTSQKFGKARRSQRKKRIEHFRVCIHRDIALNRSSSPKGALDPHNIAMQNHRATVALAGNRAPHASKYQPQLLCIADLAPLDWLAMVVE